MAAVQNLNGHDDRPMEAGDCRLEIVKLRRPGMMCRVVAMRRSEVARG